MKLKRFILFFLIGLFAFSTSLPASNGMMYKFHNTPTKKKTSAPNKSRKTKQSKGKSKSTQRKKKRIIFPFALIEFNSGSILKSPVNIIYKDFS